MTPRTSWLLGSAAVAVAVYALMWIGYIAQWHWLTTLDSSALDAFHRYGVAHPGSVTAWDVFCTVLGPTAFRLLTLVVIVVALVRRNLRIALFLVISVYAYSTSFPSGHAVGVMVGVLALLTVALPVVRRPLRAWLIGLGVVVVFAIGVGRVVLNVHHPSDVLAGWALGYAYFVACLLILRPQRPITDADETPEVPGIAR
jgi:undecaprenyl-diphosphatase